MTTKIVCPRCGRDVAVRGKGKSARLSAHNRMEAIGWRTHVSSARCAESGACALRIMLARAERAHDSAKAQSAAANVRLAEAQKSVDAARASLERTAKEIDRLREMWNNGGTK